MPTLSNLKRKLMIVIEDRGNGREFNMYMAGDKDRIDRVPEKELGPAEFWASKLFTICAQVLEEAGVLKQTVDMSKNDDKPV